MQVSTPVSAVPERADRVALRKLWWVGLLALVLALAANLVVRAIALPLLGISPAFSPLATAQPLINLTVAGVLCAVIAFAIVGRFAQRPIRLFRITALVALLVSFIPDFTLAGSMPGADAAAIGTLMLMHVVAAAICVGLLTTLARE